MNSCSYFEAACEVRRGEDQTMQRRCLKAAALTAAFSSAILKTELICVTFDNTYRTMQEAFHDEDL